MSDRAIDTFDHAFGGQAGAIVRPDRAIDSFDHAFGGQAGPIVRTDRAIDTSDRAFDGADRAVAIADRTVETFDGPIVRADHAFGGQAGAVDASDRAIDRAYRAVVTADFGLPAAQRCPGVKAGLCAFCAFLRLDWSGRPLTLILCRPYPSASRGLGYPGWGEETDLIRVAARPAVAPYLCRWRALACCAPCGGQFHAADITQPVRLPSIRPRTGR